jgi:hypothetical protein
VGGGRLPQEVKLFLVCSVHLDRAELQLSTHDANFDVVFLGCNALRTCRCIPAFHGDILSYLRSEDGGSMFFRNLGIYPELHAVTEI